MITWLSYHWKLRIALFVSLAGCKGQRRSQTSEAFLAEISVMSPRKLYIIIIKRTLWGQSIQKKHLI